MKKLNLNAIRIDGGTQSRVEINNEAVSDYAEAVKAGIEFPAVIVFFDGADHWLADGFHRFHAHKQAGKASILTDVRNGTARDAILHSLGANSTHGLRRTNADKRKAVGAMLADSEWSSWSDRKIAEACGVSQPFVSAMRKPKEVITVITPKAPKKAEKVITVITPESAETPTKAAEIARGKSSAKAKEPEPEDFDPIKELESAHAEITKLTGEIQAAEADDLKAEAIKWRRSYEHAQRQQSEAMDRAHSATERESWTMKQLRRCGKAVGVDDPKKIAAAVESFVRDHTRKAA